MNTSLNIQPYISPQKPLQAPKSALLIPTDRVKKSNIVITWAKRQSEIREAQKLRYEVFADEMGAILPTYIPGFDIDDFDDYCEHLLVRDRETWQVIGTCRVLTPGQAQLAGRTYIEGEFDLSSLQSLREHMVELGRSCVHKNYRNGVVIKALLKALINFMVLKKLSYLIGCVSIPMNMSSSGNKRICSGDAAASIWRQVRDKYMVDTHYQVRPRFPLPVDCLDQTLKINPPSLLKGYLRLGAKILGGPAWDPNFNTADLPMLLQIKDLPNRYCKYFLG
ncbi:Putative hemolysin [Nitrosomonas sp. Nm33]|uniref:GNAT family N-acetyltransferase n=1 Tax=Nitrosomonas sp. Nm33 TaxID=133724 RepID=UPI000895EEEB|nr:Putative hemolysin [Nitrosomonas sp. Nm33]